MEVEIRSLQHFKENFSGMSKGLVGHSLHEGKITAYEEELSRLRSCLSDMNRLIFTLKQENTMLSSSPQKINASKCDAFTQCAAITQSNATVNTSTELNSSESTLQIINLTPVATEFTKSEKKNSLKTCDKTTQTIECISNIDFTPREKLVRDEINDTVKQEAAFIVNLSPRLKERCEGSEFRLPSKECNVDSQNKPTFREVEEPRKSFSQKSESRQPLYYHSVCRGPSHDTEACIWCSNRVNKSLGGTFGSSNSHR
ncbi:hypothetical protein LSM04_007942 [Trypanosoma melophagium]|uniref:uncharacterized protein n=1 Tax=Trypanosoma melophagium TaxID=715481 RepID=UPI003519FEEA|nr:hypothetical protein LSM04_007942 [Trypanosoma melophagium]